MSQGGEDLSENLAWKWKSEDREEELLPHRVPELRSPPLRQVRGEPLPLLRRQRRVRGEVRRPLGRLRPQRGVQDFLGDDMI